MRSQIELIDVSGAKRRKAQNSKNTGRQQWEKEQTARRQEAIRQGEKRQTAKRRRRQKRKRRLRLVFRIFAAVFLLGVLGRLLWGTGFMEELSAFTKLPWPFGSREEQEQLEQIYAKEDSYPPELLEALEKNPELLSFVEGYLSSDGSVTGGLTEEELSQDFPLLLQYDARWGYAPYGDNNIALSGCAPTCLSMVVTALRKNGDAPPNVVADYAMERGYYQDGVGTMWSLMTEGAPDFGVRGEEIGLDENLIFARLEEGSLIICSMRPGDFTTTGHFIVLVGIQDGKIVVNDPYSRERSEKLWDYETLEYQIKNLWAFSLL